VRGVALDEGWGHQHHPPPQPGARHVQQLRLRDPHSPAVARDRPPGPSRSPACPDQDARRLALPQGQLPRPPHVDRAPGLKPFSDRLRPSSSDGVDHGGRTWPLRGGWTQSASSAHADECAVIPRPHRRCGPTSRRCCAGCGCRTCAGTHPRCSPPRRRNAGTPPKCSRRCSPKRSPAGNAPHWPPAAPRPGRGRATGWLRRWKPWGHGPPWHGRFLPQNARS
jgi:hypothetical protein